jgi:hypothetical protein
MELKDSNVTGKSVKRNKKFRGQDQRKIIAGHENTSMSPAHQIAGSHSIHSL